MARSSSSGLFPKEALFPLHPGLHLTHQCNAIYESSTIIRYLSHCVFIQTRIQYILSIIRPWFLKVGKLFIVTVIIIIIIIMTIMIIIIMINRFWFLQVGNLQAVLLLVSSLRMSVPVPGLTRNLTLLPLWLSSNPLLRIFAAISFSQVITVSCTSLARIDTKATTTNFSDNKLQRNLTGISSNKSWKWKDRTRFIITVIANSLLEGSKWCFSTGFSFISTEW